MCCPPLPRATNTPTDCACVPLSMRLPCAQITARRTRVVIRSLRQLYSAAAQHYIHLIAPRHPQQQDVPPRRFGPSHGRDATSSASFGPNGGRRRSAPSRRSDRQPRATRRHKPPLRAAYKSTASRKRRMVPFTVAAPPVLREYAPPVLHAARQTQRSEHTGQRLSVCSRTARCGHAVARGVCSAPGTHQPWSFCTRCTSRCR